ncbi:MAG: type II toxin-antitoxin system HigB family toxin [Muribaculaceae bacterium]|nr:type II toxin-antitoxin system HigB family toxin [Muribaculaceae bacterium]
MRIFTEKPLKEYAERHPEAKTAIQDWIKKVKESQWNSLADIKHTFNSVDYVGNQRYVFNIKGNDYRLVVVVQFRPQFVYIRFIGTHAEYDRINCKFI